MPRKKKVRYPKKIAGEKKAYLWNKDLVTIGLASLSKARRRSSSGTEGAEGGGEWSSCSLDEVLRM